MWWRRLSGIIFIIISQLVFGCANRVTVNVNAITSNAVGGDKNYVLTSAMDEVDKKDLFFREFSGYFEYVLQKQGYVLVDDKKDADIEILFGYGISDGKTDIATFSWPIYEAIGGETITITESSTDTSGKPTITTRTIYIPPRIARVGTSIESQHYTMFNRTVILEARSLDKSGAKGAGLWKLLISSVGESDDIRSIMPYLAAASASYIDKNTGHQSRVTLDPLNPLVLELKNTLK